MNSPGRGLDNSAFEIAMVPGACRDDDWRLLMKMLKKIAGFTGVMTCLFVSPAVADIGVVAGAFVDRTLVSDGSRWGGCMVLLSEDPADVLPACGRWLSFSCDGTYTDPVRGYRMLDQAQLALATGMAVNVIIDDSRKHDGYCFASRIDVVSP